MVVEEDVLHERAGDAEQSQVVVLLSAAAAAQEREPELSPQQSVELTALSLEQQSGELVLE